MRSDCSEFSRDNDIQYVRIGRVLRGVRSMKATVEFDVTSCHDCIFAREEYAEAIYEYGAVHYCIHPKLDEPGIKEYYNTKTFPEWCPLIKNKKE